MYIVSNTNENNGRTFISDGEEWHEITSNTAATDSRYLNQSGDNMQGDLVMDSYNIINAGNISATTLSGALTGNVIGNLTGNVTATGVLADGVTATTQNSGNNSNKVATTKYVDNVGNNLKRHYHIEH